MRTRNKIVYLCGFMASGKSTLGEIVANVIGWNFFDLDKEIEKNQQKSITEIFDESGEKYFRNIETEMLHLLSDRYYSVISLGGGTVTSEDNLNFCLENGLLVYIKVTPEKIYNRLKHRLDRPLVKSFVVEGKEKRLKNKIEQMLAEREKFYLRSHVIFEPKNLSFGKSIDVLVSKIKGLIDERN